MATMQAQSDKDKLDRAEAVALAGMYFHADLAVPADAFRHPGRRAVVMAWKQLGQVCDGSEMQMLAEQHADKRAVTDAREDIVASEGVAQDAARWKESCAYVIQHHAEQSAQDRLDRVLKQYGRCEVSESAVAQAWERLAAARGRAAVVTPAGGLLDRLLEKARDWHGRKHIGIPVPSLPLVTEQMDGLRGLMFLGGEPGTGKTSLALQMAFDAVSANADTVGVFVSCEMSGEEIIGNLVTNLAQIPYRELLKGRESIAPDAVFGLRLRSDEVVRLLKADDQVHSLSSRWAIVTPSDLGGSFDGKEGRNPFHAVVGLVDRMKAETGATRAVVVFDNLQAMPVAEPTGGQWRGEQALERDRYTIAKLNELTDGGALDSVIVISEQNKSGQGKDDPTSFLGTGRINYAADATVLLTDPFLYGKAEGEKLRESHYYKGMRWVMWSLKKGRAGMNRGMVAMTYDFRLHRFVEGIKNERHEL